MEIQRVFEVPKSQSTQGRNKDVAKHHLENKKRPRDIRY